MVARGQGFTVVLDCEVHGVEVGRFAVLGNPPFVAQRHAAFDPGADNADGIALQQRFQVEIERDAVESEPFALGLRQVVAVRTAVAQPKTDLHQLLAGIHRDGADIL